MNTYSFHILTHRANGTVVRITDYTIQALNQAQAERLAQTYISPKVYVHIHETCSKVTLVEALTKTAA